MVLFENVGVQFKHNLNEGSFRVTKLYVLIYKDNNS